MSKDNVGAVLVVGGGIGGMQSALDLAESGLKVYLVDNSPAIGGTMAQLDKTFPTNECAMCVMSPKLVECGRHRDIEIISGASVESVEGEPGNFRVSLVHPPRYVDVDKCTGCGDCEEACPVDVPSEFDAELGSRNAIYRLYPQAIPNAFIIDKKERPPCGVACPAEINVQGYVALISKGKFKEALALINDKIPFAGVCGRICHHPCEDKCHRKEIDDPIAIAELKRFVADHASLECLATEVDKKKDKVAIVGAGPAGLTAAWQLAKLQYPVTVFEALPVAGGMLSVGIPDYRLPKETLESEIEGIKSLGVEIRTNAPIGGDLTLEDLKRDYGAIFIAVGAHKSKELNIEGQELEDVLRGVEFLRELNLGEKPKVGNKVVVIGGGNVAIDCACSALRLGAKEVHVACLESRDEMPAHEWEIRQAEEEGIVIHPSRGPKRILADGQKVSGLETIKCIFVFNGEGRFNPSFADNTESTIGCDTVIIAIGQASDLSFLDNGTNITDGRTISVDPLSLATAEEGIFAGGDIVSGPASAIEAMAHGRRAALSIDRYLRGEDIRKGREEGVGETAELPAGQIERKPRVAVSTLSVEQRRDSFGEVELGFSQEAALDEARRCLNCGVCSECLECEKICEAKAIDHHMKEYTTQLEVGAIILSPGFDLFDAQQAGEYGFGVYDNVITNIQFERMLNASGPSQGAILRPSDGKVPRRIAFIQCVGSRDTARGNEYCCSLGCMASTKEAIIAKEHESDLEVTIFFIDMRAFGKGFEKYYVNAREEHGIRYQRSMISKIVELQQSKNLKIIFASEDETLREEEFDLVILACGLVPKEEVKELASTLDVSLNEYGFCKREDFLPNRTNRSGIFVSGVFNEPKDIPDTVVEASSAAAEASGLLATARGTMTKKKEYPPERHVGDEPPRIGVFVCRCGRNIGSIVRVPEVVEYAGKLDSVVHADEFLYTCSQDALEKIKEKITEYDLNRVIVASCTPLTHAPLFRDTIRETGLNPYLFEMVSIREHCSWVHMNEPDMATTKAKELVAMAVAKIELHRPLKRALFDLNHRALVIGGGISGLTASMSLAQQGFEVILIEKEDKLGGHLSKIHHTLEGQDPQELLKETLERVQEHPLIHIYTEAEIKEVAGHVGNYTTQIRLKKEEKDLELEHGVIITATGAKEHESQEYLYGRNPNVVTQSQFEEMISQDKIDGIETIVMIQCVGSRDDARPYCSKVCCSHAIKNALKVKELKPNANAFVLYRDIRTYGFKEKYYQEARSKGIIFVRYDENEKPQVTEENGQLSVRLRDLILGEDIVMEPDVLVLSTGIVPANTELAQVLKVPLTSDGFFMEAHAKIRPLDFTTEGMFVCGLAHSPRFVTEAIAQAKGASMRAVTVLAKEKMLARAEIAMVNEKRCTGCGVCEFVCAYDARKLDQETKIAQVIEALCQGCGACAAACPSGATQQQGFEAEEILSMVDAVS